MKREEAWRELNKEIISPEALLADRKAVLKKLALTDAEFDAIITNPPKPHSEYPRYFPGYNFLKRI